MEVSSQEFPKSGKKRKKKKKNRSALFVGTLGFTYHHGHQIFHNVKAIALESPSSPPRLQGRVFRDRESRCEDEERGGHTRAQAGQQTRCRNVRAERQLHTESRAERRSSANERKHRREQDGDLFQAQGGYSRADERYVSNLGPGESSRHRKRTRVGTLESFRIQRADDLQCWAWSPLTGARCKDFQASRLTPS